MKSIFNYSLVVLMLAFGTLLMGCNDESEPAVAKVKLEMKAKTSLSTINHGKVMTTGLVFNEILLGVTELEFETLEEQELEDVEGEDEEEEIEFEGNFVVDLISGTSTPDFGIADIAPGIYEEMEIEMEPILEGGNTMFISFVFVNENQDSVIVEYSNNFKLEFELEREAGFVLDGGVTNQMLVMMNLDALFDRIDFNVADVDNDGIVRINGSSNVDLAEAIAGNLSQVLDAGEDEDGDDEIDED